MEHAAHPLGGVTGGHQLLAHRSRDHDRVSVAPCHHGPRDRDDALIDRIAASNTIVSQTISVGYRRWLDDGQRRQRSELLQRILKTGCRMIASTDCGIPNVGHAELAGGLEVFSELGGLSPVQVLRLATSASGELLGMADRGALEPGRRADVLVVSGDPTANLGALTRVRYVIKRGQVVFAAP